MLTLKLELSWVSIDLELRWSGNRTDSYPCYDITRVYAALHLEPCWS